MFATGGPLTRDIEQRGQPIGRWLLAQGVERGDNVGVCYERTPEIAVALCAVLKTAAAYVPLEPTYPSARKGYILHQSGVTCLLADRPYELPDDCATRLVTPQPAELRISATAVLIRVGDMVNHIHYGSTERQGVRSRNTARST